jgi:hypothetical protein
VPIGAGDEVWQETLLDVCSVLAGGRSAHLPCVELAQPLIGAACKVAVHSPAGAEVPATGGSAPEMHWERERNVLLAWRLLRSQNTSVDLVTHALEQRSRALDSGEQEGQRIRARRVRPTDSARWLVDRRGAKRSSPHVPQSSAKPRTHPAAKARASVVLDRALTCPASARQITDDSPHTNSRIGPPACVSPPGGHGTDR